jgi:hypothetical protein
MKIFDRYYNIFGCEIHIRILPRSYRNDLRVAHSLFDSEEFSECRQYLKYMRSRYCNPKYHDDADINRLNGMIDLEYHLM